MQLLYLRWYIDKISCDDTSGHNQTLRGKRSSAYNVVPHKMKWIKFKTVCVCGGYVDEFK